jgi:lipopolysaccharide/colanic/teichoic acid biosynthesis glycosyltransferase
VSLTTRVETAPYLLLGVDALIAAVVAVVSLPVGVLQVAAPIIVLLVIYISGEYSLLSEVRVHPRLGLLVACAIFILACAASFLAANNRWLLAWATVGRVVVVVASCLALLGAHDVLGRFLRARSRQYLLHLRADMEQAGASLTRHLSRSGYPARVMLDADAECLAEWLPVDVWVSGTGTGRSRTHSASCIDPAWFCDVALRVLPPAVLSLRSDYVSWETVKRRWYDPVKRMLDVAAASVLLVLSIPLLAAAAIGILVLAGRPVLFRQVRVGRFGARFSLLKFRTLRESQVPSPTPNEDIEERVFPFGALLRRTRLDELPQLLNILRGDMSLVGPRPEMEYFHNRWAKVIPHYKQRLIVRPGLSGWAQVRFPHTSSELDYWDKTAFDLWYVAHRNPGLDFRICLRTIGVMLFGSGAR